MEYKRYDKTIYIRMDKGDEMIGSILEVCRKENILSAIFSGIGGCRSAEIQTYIPEENSFELQKVEGMLELVSMNGSITSNDQDELFHHTHAVFSYKEGGEHFVAAGHIRSVEVLYTAEIELRPVIGGVIRRQKDPETGTGFWKFT
ncbi:MAG: DUF296 domain-containing protein [Saccharofermentans sp.]|nr:DUF296 domain-containing protein [Saccharofermentans sp.]